MRYIQNYILTSVVVYTFALTLGIGKICFMVQKWVRKCTNMRFLIVLVNFIVPVDQFPFHGSQISHLSISIMHYYTSLSLVPYRSVTAHAFDPLSKFILLIFLIYVYVALSVVPRFRQLEILLSETYTPVPLFRVLWPVCGNRHWKLYISKERN
jgi:hypothetical protein